MNDVLFHKVMKCRVCTSENIELIHDFGFVPLADKLTASPDQNVPAAPLTVHFCQDCSHLQIGEDIDPGILFNDNYPYYSSSIPEVVSHFKESYQAIIDHIALNSEDVVMEIASNDGVLLKHFKEHTDHLVGVEPSSDHAEVTEKLGIKTYARFFDEETARDLLKDLQTKPKVLIGSNVLAHVPNPRSFVRGLRNLLSEDGVIIIEVPYSLNIIKNNSFDVIFHQHFSYFNLHSLMALFDSQGLSIYHLDRINPQGGSFRLYINHHGQADKSIQDMLKEEVDAGLTTIDTYREFSKSITRAKDSVLEGLKNLKASGKSVVGYGAPGKAATMLNYFGIDGNLMNYLVDISPSKQHKYFPFTDLKIFPVDELYDNTPDYIVILAWNYTASILKSLHGLREKGAKFIVPYPVFKEV